MFGLELPDHGIASAIPTLLYQRHVRLASARGAFSWLAERLQPRTVWLPSFLCPVVIPCFRDTGTAVRFFPVDVCLHIETHWLAEVHEGDIVVLIDYFGLPTPDQIAASIVARGAWLIEDACQALLNHSFSSHAHYVIASPRKFVGVPDGGILASAHLSLPSSSGLSRADADWWLVALSASRGRAEFDRYGDDRRWFAQFQDAEKNAPMDARAMSELSTTLLDRLPFDLVAKRRRKNYAHLQSALAAYSLLGPLPPSVVPIGFPIRVQNRDRVRDALFRKEIFPPVHWPIGSHVPAEFTASHTLAAEIMTLPCDQRLSESDIERMIDAFTAVAHQTDHP